MSVAEIPRLTADDIRKVATLARLKLSDAEVARFADQLGQVLEYVRLLDELDTTDVEPLAHAVEQANVLRDDEPTASLPLVAALQNAPKTDGQTFLVPAILGGE
jgi:aspartyl-tRNA(Asn)/glutamyl-tRNA(Gln) amidotransferase subunit C